MATRANVKESLLGLLQMGLDVLFPPRCPSCRAYVAAQGNFCAACYAKLRQIHPPLCTRCGTPFAFTVEAEMECPECLAHPPVYAMARAALAYDATSAPLIRALKFHDQWANLDRYVTLMQQAGVDVLAGAELLIPVPLHWRRLLKRRFNQSALLAYRLSARTGIPCVPNVLLRVRYTPPQMRLDRKTRLRNVRRAFAVPLAARSQLKGKTVLLVDDVVTTGATITACCKALRKAGVREVRVLSLAKTIRE